MEYIFTEQQKATENSPRSPMTVEETGLSRDLLHKLVAKTLNLHGTLTPSALVRELKLPAAIIAELLKDLQKLLLVEARGLAGADMRSEVRYAVGGKGHEFVAEANAQSQYVGPAPVPLERFIRQVEAQSIRNERVTREDLEKALAHLVLPSRLIDQLGPAFNSARSVLLYGGAGNGKTSIAEAAGTTLKQLIHVPYCLEVGGQIINFFDPLIHTPASDTPTANTTDARWQLCRRPIVATGGELTLDMLDLSYNESARYYEAPAHIKATGGVFIIDDFGRQRTDPQSILNRWIVPLERGVDQLRLHTGKKFPVPFDELVIFSTNIPPEKLSDSGGLRRLHYKIFIPSPTHDDYRRIFFDTLDRNGLTLPDADFEVFFEKFYRRGTNSPSGYHPKYLIDFALSFCAFGNVGKHVSIPLLEAAFENLYANHKEDEHPF